MNTIKFVNAQWGSVMKKTIIGLCVVALIAVFGGRAYYLQSQKKTEQVASNGSDIINVGVLLPLSSFVAKDAQDALIGLNAAQKSINLTNPKKQVRLHIAQYIEDSKYTEIGTLSAYNRIADCDAFILFGELTTKVLSSRINEDKKVAISLVDIDDTPTTTNDYLFRGWYSLDKLASEMAGPVVKMVGDGSIAVLKVKTSDGDRFAELMKMRMKEANVSVSIVETFPLATTDTKTQVVKILDKKPSVVVVWGYGPGYFAALNSLMELKYNGKIVTGPDIPFNTNLVANNGDGIYYVTLEFNSDDLKDTRENVYTAFAYESLYILSYAFQNTDKTTEQVRKNLLSSQDFDSIFGKIHYLPNGNLELPRFEFKQLQADGTSKIIKE